MPALPTFSAYHDALMAKLDDLNTSIQGITTAVQANTVAVQAVQSEVAALQGTPGKTMQDIYDKIDSSTADLTQVEDSLSSIDNLLGILISSTDNPAYTQINDLADLLKVLMNPAEHSDYFNLHELRIALTGQTVVDAVENESYSPNFEGIILKMQNLQGMPTSSREGLVDNRTDLRNIFDALSGPPVVGAEDPVNWWQEIQDIIGLASNGIDIATDLYDFLNRAAGTAAQAATAGTTGATAIGQWITAMALAVIAMQMNNAQGTRILMKQNTDTMTTQLEYIRDHTGILPIMSSDTTQMGYTNLKDLDTTLDFLLSELNLLMNYPNRVNLATIRDALTCICPWLEQIADNTTEVVFGLEGGVTGPPALRTSGPSAEHCQRSYWLMFELVDIIRVFNRSKAKITEKAVITAYAHNFYNEDSKGFNIDVSQADARNLAIAANKVLRNNETARMDSILSALENDAATWNTLQNAIFSAASADAALAAWQAAADTLGNVAVGYAFLNEYEKAFIKYLVFAELLNNLFSGDIPRDASDISGYSTDCTGLGGPAGTPTEPPGGWASNLCFHSAYSESDPYAHPSDYRRVYFYRDDPSKGDYAAYFAARSGMPDRWTITTNLRAWHVNFGTGIDSNHDIEIYDNGVLLATFNYNHPDYPQYTFTADTTSVYFIINPAFNNSMCLRTPYQASGWPFTGS